MAGCHTFPATFFCGLTRICYINPLCSSYSVAQSATVHIHHATWYIHRWRMCSVFLKVGAVTEGHWSFWLS